MKVRSERHEYHERFEYFDHIVTVVVAFDMVIRILEYLGGGR